MPSHQTDHVVDLLEHTPSACNLILLSGAARKPERLHLAAAGIAVNQFIRILPRLALALLTAGFLGQLLPGELIGSLIGAESGTKGILIASLAGGFTPGGPIISFPIVVVLREAGAGTIHPFALAELGGAD